jgi:GH35 family endo-1,4-beta-xylanase
MSAFPDIDYWDVVNEPIHTGVQAKAAYTLASKYSKNLIVNEYGVLPSDSIGFKTYMASMPYQVGLQCHIPQNEVWDINQIVNSVNSYTDPHISEISITSARELAGTLLWDEQKQADYVVQLYTALFNSNAKSITWWNLYDGDPWRPHIGLIKTDGTKKPAYMALTNLLASWKTTSTGVTDNVGTYKFTGYYGTYEVIVGGRVRGKVVLNETTANGIVTY